MTRKKFATDKEHTLTGEVLNFIIRFLVSPIFKAVWLKELSGKENLPRNKAYILAANHQSFLDFVMLTCCVPKKNLRFLAAGKFYNSNLWRPLMRYTGQIKVSRKDRESKKEAFKKALGVLENGEVLAIFPQGTRSRNGKIEKTFTGVAKLAMLSGVPVIPVGIKGAFELWPPGQKPSFEKKICIHFGRQLVFDQSKKSETDPELIRENCRKFTNELMSEIAKLSGKEYLPE